MGSSQENKLYTQLIQDYNDGHDHSGVSGRRLAKRIAALAQIGLTGEGGVERPGYSKEEKQAKGIVIEWMKAAGLEVYEDGAGNVFGRLEGTTNLPPIVSGSHVDTVPNGGNFDGVLGVLSALEVVEAWRESGYVPKKPFEVAIFSDEEGSRFKSGLTGSRAFMGKLDHEELKHLVDSEGQTFEEVIEAYGSNITSYLDYEFKRKAIDMFIEVHIEQGKMLEKEDQAVGIVSGIAGPAWMEVTFQGVAGHAGNTPMIGRKDPVVAAALFIKKVEELPGIVSETAVATVGQVQVKPNGVNVIAEEVTITVDVRDIHEETRNELVQMLKKEANDIADMRGITANLDINTSIKPLPIKDIYQHELAEILIEHDLRPVYIPSGAGHDAMILGSDIPIAMIFVRSKDGISHHPDEWSSLSDCIQGVHVLKDFIMKKMSD